MNMERIVEKTVKVTLIMNQEEAEWLHRQMQNPLHGQKVDLESEADTEMRAKFFHASNTRG
jgi:hypothetical protein